MKRLYSQPLVAVQEIKCVVIFTTLSPPLHFTVNIMTQYGGQLNTLGWDTLGIITPLRSESGSIFIVCTWVPIFSFVNEWGFYCFLARAMKYVKLYPATTCLKKYTPQRAVLNGIPWPIPVRSRVIKHHILFPCVSVTLHYTSVAAQQTKQTHQPFCPATSYPSLDTQPTLGVGVGGGGWSSLTVSVAHGCRTDSNEAAKLILHVHFWEFRLDWCYFVELMCTYSNTKNTRLQGFRGATWRPYNIDWSRQYTKTQ